MGAVLAGGRSRRYGSPKTLAVVDGEPLIWRPIGAMREAFGNAVVVCKPETPIPELPAGTEVWYEEDFRSHPLAGIVAALRRAEGKRVAVVACDMPAVTTQVLLRLAEAGPGTVVSRSAEGLEPLAAVYDPEAVEALTKALDRELPLREAVESLAPFELEVVEAEVANVNRPADARRLTA